MPTTAGELLAIALLLLGGFLGLLVIPAWFLEGTEPGRRVARWLLRRIG